MFKNHWSLFLITEIAFSRILSPSNNKNIIYRLMTKELNRCKYMGIYGYMYVIFQKK